MASAKPSSLPTAAPTPATTVGCKPRVFSPAIASDRRLALVNLKGAEGYVVRDLTDIHNPFSVVNLGYGIAVPRFINGGEISYSVDCGYARGPLKGAPMLEVPAAGGHDSNMFTWTADGTTLIYLSDTGSGLALHQVKGGQDRVLAKGIPSIPAVGCESEFCSLGDVTLQLIYSPDESKISYVQNLIGRTVFRIWTSDGRVLNSSDAKGYNMPVWSGTGLYFQDSAGIEVWQNGVISQFLPRVSWLNPIASPDGGQITYSTRDATGFSHVWIADTAMRVARELKAARSGPAFLSGRYLWYTGERSCIASDHCPDGWKVVGNGKAYIYDLETGAESSSVITAVFDVWPRGA